MQKSVYLPKEGLQGEDIPSHATWEDMNFESITISFQHPLKLKEIHNSASKEIHDDHIVIEEVEWGGYLGVIFESCKTSSTEIHTQVKYSFRLSNGQVAQETREICLFRPELNILYTPERITVDTVTGSVDNEIRLRNVGQGTLILHIDTMEDSPLALETPSEQTELLHRIESDFCNEILTLEKEYPQFEPLLQELLTWEGKEFKQIVREEQARYVDYLDRLSKAITSDKRFSNAFLGAYAKVVIKNIEVLELVKRFVAFYESLISKNILLINPLDEISLTDLGQGIVLKLFQTDRIFNTYEEIILPRIELTSKKAGKIAVYNLFGWE